MRSASGPCRQETPDPIPPPVLFFRAVPVGGGNRPEAPAILPIKSTRGNATPSPPPARLKEDLRMPESNERGHQLGQLISMEVPVSVRLCEKLMPLGDVLALRPGTLLDFPQSHEAPLGLYVNGAPVGQGYAADLEKSLGFVVERIDQEAREDVLRGTP